MDEFVAYPSRWRLALLFLLSLGFVVVSLGMIGAFGAPWVSPRRSLVVGMGIGWFSLIFSGACVISIGRSLLDTGALLRIGEQGIWWKRWSDVIIPWSEITEVTTWQHKGQKFLILHLRDPAQFPGQGVMGWMGKANRALTGGDIGITMTGTDRRVNEALAAVDCFRR